MTSKTNPSRADLEKVSKDYAEINQQEDPYPPGAPVLTHVYPFQMYEIFPTKAQVEAEVYRLRMNRSGEHTHLQAEHFNIWLREAYLDKEVPPPPPNQQNV